MKRLLKFLQAWIPQHLEDSTLQVKSLIGLHTHARAMSQNEIGGRLGHILAMQSWHCNVHPSQGRRVFCAKKSKKWRWWCFCCNALCKSIVTSRKVAIHKSFLKNISLLFTYVVIIWIPLLVRKNGFSSTFVLGFDKREVSHNLIKRFFLMPTKNTYSRKTRLNLSLEL